jgi:hypothetical protein
MVSGICASFGSGSEGESYKGDQRHRSMTTPSRIVLNRPGLDLDDLASAEIRGTTGGQDGGVHREGTVTPADGGRPRELPVRPGFSEE